MTIQNLNLRLLHLIFIHCHLPIVTFLIFAYRIFQLLSKANPLMKNIPSFKVLDDTIRINYFVLNLSLLYSDYLRAPFSAFSFQMAIFSFMNLFKIFKVMKRKESFRLDVLHCHDYCFDFKHFVLFL